MIETLSLARAQASTLERPAYIRTVPRVPRRKRASLLKRLVRWMAGRPADDRGCCA